MRRDTTAIDAFGRLLEGSGRPLIITSGTLVIGRGLGLPTCCTIWSTATIWAPETALPGRSPWDRPGRLTHPVRATC